MKKYLSFFRLMFTMGLQYRAAALAGIATQFVWGALNVLVFHAFYTSDMTAFPMTLQATSCYIWMQQAFLAFFAAWMMENQIFESIINGNIAYELCRPIHIYDMWFSRSAANRLSRAVLRCFPILIFAAFLPFPYGLILPVSLGHFFLTILTLLLGLGVTVAFCMLVYVLTFFTISPMGLRMLFTSAVEFLAGGIIPLPFFPRRLQNILELLPFASMQNVPLRIYSGDLSGPALGRAILLQIFWFTVLVTAGRYLCHMAEKHVAIQGG